MPCSAARLSFWQTVAVRPLVALRKTVGLPPFIDARSHGRHNPSTMQIDGVEIEDTFAEAFPMVAARAIITADSAAWAMTAARESTGYATSVIACDAEAGVERELGPDDTPDGRPGVSVLFFGFSRDKLEKAVASRIGQCVMTCATTACYNGIDPIDKPIRIGGSLRYFGDGFQASKLLEAGDPTSGASTPHSARRRFWRVPVMDGEFLCEDKFGTVKGVAGGNFLILASTPGAALDAAERAVAAIRDSVRDVIMPFPGGVVRSGSKVGSRYKKLRASTNDAYCPTLRGITATALPTGVAAVYEIVVDGLSLAAVEAATRQGVRAACRPGVIRISAGNYGGNLGPHHVRLHEVLK
jgi:formylmethanofuran--tetrahydromethanopterin N-formyltransferase